MITDADERVIQFLRQGNKLMAVKVFKEQTGCDLKWAKDYIDDLYEQYAPKPEKPKVSNYKEWEATLKDIKPRPSAAEKEVTPYKIKEAVQDETHVSPVKDPAQISMGDHYDKGERQGCLELFLALLSPALLLLKAHSPDFT